MGWPHFTIASQSYPGPAISGLRFGWPEKASWWIKTYWFSCTAAMSPPSKVQTNFDQYFGGLIAGQTLRQPELANTLNRIARNGPDEFYTGRTSDLLVAQMARGVVKGLITKG